MNLVELGAVGELVGGVAVVATLVYLALQVRQSNSIEQAETHRSFIRDWNEAILRPLTDPATAPVLRRANADFHALTEDEKIWVFGYYGQVILLAQQLYTLNREERADRLLVEQIDDTVLSALAMPGVATWWEHTRSLFSPPYVEHLEARRRVATPVALSEVYPALSAAVELSA